MLHELGLPSIAVCVDRSRWSWVACLNSIIIVLFAGYLCAHSAVSTLSMPLCQSVCLCSRYELFLSKITKIDRFFFILETSELS